MSIVVVLYSKYSQKSIDLLQSMDGVLDYRKICIDNENIRNEIKLNKKGVVVDQVPCIFIVYSNGNLDKYEGQDAFKWVHDTLFSMKQIIEKPQQPQSLPFMNQEPAKPIPVQFYTEEEPTMEDNKRSMSSAPLIIKQEENTPQKNEEKHVKGVKKSTGDSVQNMAAQLQAEREKEDENLHPNALSKVKGE